MVRLAHSEAPPACWGSFTASTNKNLSQCIHAGSFREDLFFRLNAFRITLPPLRDRITDLPALAACVLNREGKGSQHGVKHLGKDALNLITHYHWPGNIWALENVLSRATILSSGMEIGPDSLCLEMRSIPPDLPSPPSDNGSYHETVEAYSKEVIIDALKKAGLNQTKAATYLKLQRTYFTRLLKQKHIPTKPPQAEPTL